MLLILSLATASRCVFAIGEIERGYGFVLNAISMGSYLPDLEGERAKIHMEAERTISELRLEAGRLAKTEEIALYRSQIAAYEKIVNAEKHSLQNIAIYQKELVIAVEQLKSLIIQTQKNDVTLDKLAVTTRNWDDLNQLILKALLGGSEDQHQMIVSCEQSPGSIYCAWLQVSQISQELRQKNGDLAQTHASTNLTGIYREFLNRKIKYDREAARFELLVKRDEDQLNSARTYLANLEAN
jgi:hypothetical protein